MSLPTVVLVVSSPTWIYTGIETWNMVKVTPASIIIMRAIPTTVPEAPPPAIIEEEVYIYPRSNVDIVRVRQRYHLRRRVKYDGWR
jgi:hypothetical protein